MRLHKMVAVVFMVAFMMRSIAPVAADQPSAREILAASGVQGGVVVHVGCGDGKLTAALHANDRYYVHGLDTDARNVAAARKYIQSLGLYGNVFVEQSTGDHIPYIDNSVNLIVAENLGGMAHTSVGSFAEYAMPVSIRPRIIVSKQPARRYLSWLLPHYNFRMS